MTADEGADGPESRFTALLVGAARFPGVRIDREAYLRSALARYCSEQEIGRAVDATPATAGISADVLDRAAHEAIRYETAKAGALSAATGLPGLLLLPATVPADMAQYVGHMLRIAQKLAYLYSWPDLLPEDGDELDEAAKGVLTLFAGVMVGTGSAGAAVGKVATEVSSAVVRKLPRKALTRGDVDPVVQTVAGHLGVQLTKQTLAKTVSKAIPLLGAVVSGGLTVTTFLPMAHRLREHLAGLDLARPKPQVTDGRVIDGEIV